MPNGMVVAQVNPWETDALYREIFVERCYERSGLSVRTDCAIIDVGANIGLASLYFHTRAPRVPIVAVEPAPLPLAALAVNVDRHGANCKIVAAAAGRCHGRGTLCFYGAHSDFSTLYPDPVRDGRVAAAALRAEGRLSSADLATIEGGATAEAIDVEVLGLADVFALCPVGPIGLVKIDAERAEDEILAGVPPGAWSRVQQIALEVHGDAATAKSMASRIGALGFGTVVRPEPFAGFHMIYAQRST